MQQQVSIAQTTSCAWGMKDIAYQKKAPQSINVNTSAGAACTAFPKMYTKVTPPKKISPGISLEHSNVALACFTGVVKKISLDGMMR